MKSFFSIKVLPLLFIIVVAACKKDVPIAVKVEDEKKEIIETLEATTSGTSGVVLNGKLNSEEAYLERGFMLAKTDFLPGDTAVKIRYYKSATVSGAGFSSSISFGLDSGATYYYRAYVKRQDSLFAGLPKTFVYSGNAPLVIDEMSEGSYHLGDTVTIHGKNFSERYVEGYLRNYNVNEAYIWRLAVKVVNDTTISWVIPNLLYKNSDFRIADVNTGQYKTFKTLQLATPVIESFTPTAYMGDTIEVKGDHFDTDTGRVKVTFDVGQEHMPGKVIASTRKLIKVVVPDYLSATQRISVTAQRQTVTAASDFKLKDPVITRWPTDLKYGDTFRLYGKNLRLLSVSSQDGIFTYLNRRLTPIKKVTNDYWEFYVDYIPYPHRKGILTVENDRYPKIVYDKLRIADKYFWAAELPFVPRVYTSTLKIDNEIWIMAGNSDSSDPDWFMYRFNPADYSWKSYKLPLNFAHSDVLVNGKVYIYDSPRKLWEFNPATGNSVPIADMPTDVTIGKIFSVGSDIFTISGTFFTAHDDSELFVYVPSTRTWERRKTYQGPTLGTYPKSFEANGLAYFIAHDSSVWTYNPQTDAWAERSKGIALGYIGPPVLYNNKVYITGSVTFDDPEHLWEYNLAADVWKDLGQTTGKNRRTTVSFIIDNRFFIGGGQIKSTTRTDLIETSWP